MPTRELCDIQNEESEKFIYELKIGLRRLPLHNPYAVGYGPNPNVHDDGAGDLTQTKEKNAKV